MTTTEVSSSLPRPTP